MKLQGRSPLQPRSPNLCPPPATSPVKRGLVCKVANQESKKALSPWEQRKPWTPELEQAEQVATPSVQLKQVSKVSAQQVSEMKPAAEEVETPAVYSGDRNLEREYSTEVATPCSSRTLALVWKRLVRREA